MVLLLCTAALVPVLPACGIPAGAPPPTGTPTLTPTRTATGTPTPTITPTPTVTPVPVLCGGPPVMHILIVGSDARQDSYAVGLADSMRLVRVDFVDPGVRILAFPRDLYVEIPGIQDHHGITHGKLNQAFLYGNPGYNYYDGPGRGSGLLAQTLEHNFQARVDHYLAVNLQTFVRIIDALGGIDIELPYVIDGRVRDSRDPNRYFAAGSQHLNGYRTMLLARLRPKGDFQRLAVQNLILYALADRVLNPGSILKLPEIIRAFDASIQTDLGPTEWGQLLCLRRSLSSDEITFLSFPETLFQAGRVRDPVLGNTSILEADFEVLSALVKNFQDGVWRGPEGSTREQISP